MIIGRGITMIKKISSLVLALAVILSVVSCGKADKVKTGDNIEFGNYKGHTTWRVLDIQGPDIQDMHTVLL